MPDLLIAKPDASEHAPYYSRYVDLVAAGDILGTLATQIDATLAELRNVSEADSLKRYAAGKWSVREAVGHMIDTERIFAYRALRFARGDRQDLPGFEQDDYVAAAQFDRRPWAGLLEEFEAVRRSNVLMFRGLGEEAWRRQGVANGDAMSVRAAAYVIAGHELHHMRVLRKHYGL
jgi:DinB superfamily